MTDPAYEAMRRSAIRQFAAALDRCEHGRHARDSCFDCPDRMSTGNLHLPPGTRIGTTLYGTPIVAPGQMDRGDLTLWTEDGTVPV